MGIKQKTSHKNTPSSNNGVFGDSGSSEINDMKQMGLTVKSKSWKKSMKSLIKTEFDYITNLFDVLDIQRLHHGRRNEDEEDGDNMEVSNVPEKKVFKNKSASKKGKTTDSKGKPFPTTIEGLEKELEEFKGTTITYQQRLRKKGLQSRLTKKKRKELLKQGKKHNITINGAVKQIKPVLNSDGNIVSNKFDFADSESKKENKKKSTSLSIKSNQENDAKGLKNTSTVKMKNENTDHVGNNLTTKTLENRNNQTSITESNTSEAPKTILKRNNSLNNNQTSDNSPQKKFKKENNEVSPKVENVNNKSLNRGPLFNKDNKMVFSKVYIPENRSKPLKKKKVEKDPQKILQKIKEDAKKISDLQKEDSEKAVALKEKQTWLSALKRARGEKVKDDPDLLRKTITREKNKKMKSQKKWEERTEKVKKDKEDRQKKRSENIKARSMEKKKRKMKRAIKKGSFVNI